MSIFYGLQTKHVHYNVLPEPEPEPEPELIYGRFLQISKWLPCNIENREFKHNPGPRAGAGRHSEKNL